MEMLKSTLVIVLLAFGCSNGIPENQKIGPISYDKNIKQIFKARCSQCHNQNWPEKNWLDKDTAVKNKDKIRQAVWVIRNMPPSGEIPLIERVMIKKWVDRGTP